MPPGTIGLLAAGIVASVILGRSAKRRFDGVVGDVYGALIVCLEVFFLVGFAVAHGPRS
jgi:cobalamin synthase